MGASGLPPLGWLVTYPTLRARRYKLGPGATELSGACNGRSAAANHRADTRSRNIGSRKSDTARAASTRKPARRSNRRTSDGWRSKWSGRYSCGSVVYGDHDWRLAA